MDVDVPYGVGAGHCSGVSKGAHTGGCTAALRFEQMEWRRSHGFAMQIENEQQILRTCAERGRACGSGELLRRRQRHGWCRHRSPFGVCRWSADGSQRCGYKSSEGPGQTCLPPPMQVYFHVALRSFPRFSSSVPLERLHVQSRSVPFSMGHLSRTDACLAHLLLVTVKRSCLRRGEGWHERITCHCSGHRGSLRGRAK